MKKSIAVKPKRGRPATGRDAFVGIRLPDSLIQDIKAWSEKHEAASRSEAIRRLVELGLTVRPKAKQPSPAHAVRAKALARTAIDNMSDGTAHPDEQAQ